MRKLLVATVAAATALPVVDALAADMPLKAPPIVYVAAPNWTGFYLGGEVGGGWEREQVTIVTNNPGAAFPPGTVLNPVKDHGGLGGVYGGFNYQISNFVVGIDGDFAGLGFHGTAIDVSAVNRDVANESSTVDWVATLTGRLGYAVNGNWLLFAKGGWAWAHFPATSVTNTPAGALVATTTGADTREGWTAGGGVEYRFLAHWSAKVEYDYVSFNTANFSITETNAAGVVSSPLRSAVSSMSMVKGGIAYGF
jgi:outer membrane immunogenic protein